MARSMRVSTIAAHLRKLLWVGPIHMWVSSWGGPSYLGRWQVDRTASGGTTLRNLEYDMKWSQFKREWEAVNKTRLGSIVELRDVATDTTLYGRRV